MHKDTALICLQTGILLCCCGSWTVVRADYNLYHLCFKPRWASWFGWLLIMV